MKGTKCPYCGGKVLYSGNSTLIYKRDFGGVYYCEHFPKCDSYVGTHKETRKSLGRLANSTLRTKKKLAHFYFDAIWKEKQRRDCKGQRSARAKGYNWLSKQLNIPVKKCHIGMFDEELCDKVIKLCKPYADKIIKLKKVKKRT